MYFPDSPYAQRYISCIAVLAQHAGLTIDELHRELCQTTPLSLAHVYKVVKYMIDQEFVIREKKHLYLHRRCLIWWTTISESMNNTHLHHRELDLHEWQSRRISAGSLAEIEVIRSDILLSLRLHSQPQPFYYVNSHPYFTFHVHDKELQLSQSLVHDQSIYCIFNHDHRLDRSIITQKIADGEQCAIVSESWRPAEGYCLNIYGEYLFELVLPAAIASEFSKLFSQSEQITDALKSSFKNLFEKRLTHTLMITRHSKRASHTAKMIEKDVLKYIER